MPRNHFFEKDYINAFKNIRLSSHSLRMLQLNYHSPKMNYPNYNSANLHQGKLGRLIGVALRWKPLPDQKIYTLVHFHKISNEWHWELKKEAAAALKKLGLVDEAIVTIPEEIEDPKKIFEGALKTISVNAYERSPLARQKCILHYGNKCAVCGIILTDIYGDVAEGFIHVHHLQPISGINSKYQIDPIKDLRPVCPTCHAIIHLRKPPYTIRSIKKIIKSEKASDFFTPPRPSQARTPSDSPRGSARRVFRRGPGCNP